MKKLCVIAYVFGDEYQGYIPLFIYSILKTYPEYEVKVYLDRELKPEIKIATDILDDMGVYQITENLILSGL